MASDFPSYYELPISSFLQFYFLSSSFVDLAQRRHSEIDDEYEMIAEALEAIESGSDLANQLSDQLDHEKLVLEQKKQVRYLGIFVI